MRPAGIFYPQVWVANSQRGLGLGRALMQAAEAEALRRGCRQVVLSTHSFQAPRFYERLGYVRQAVIEGEPAGHSNIVYAKRLGGQYEISPPLRVDPLLRRG